MKKILYVIASFAALACLWACNPEQPENPGGEDEPTPTEAGITYTGETVINVAAADVETVNISFKATVAWTATVDDEWVVIAPKKGDAGDATIKVNVDDNTLADPRSVKLTITAGEATKEITITQAGAFVPFFDVDPSSCQFSGFGEGEPYTVEREAAEYVIPVETNLEWVPYMAYWDSEINDAVLTDHNAWMSVAPTNAGIKITVTADNDTYDARVDYVYVACHLGEDFDSYGGYGACILIVQPGLEAPTTPTLAWTKSYSELNENIAATSNTRLALSDGVLFLSDGNAIYGLDPATGNYYGSLDIAVESIDSDDAGNLIMMKNVAVADVAETGLQIMWTPSIAQAPTLLHTMSVEGLWGTYGNFRVRGDLADGKAVVTSYNAGMRFYYAWEFDKGEYIPCASLEPVRSPLNATGDGNTADQCAALPVSPDNLKDGIIYRGYVVGQPDGDQLTYLRVDPTVPHWSNPEWKLITNLGSGGNECQNNLDILNVGEKRIMAFTQGCWFNWAPYNANIYVLDITDLNDVKVLANIPTAEWIGDEPTPAGLYLSGADILLHDTGSMVELYAVNACLSKVAKYVFAL